MITNEERYMEKILTYDEKSRVESYISRSVYYFRLGFSLLIISLLGILSMFVTFFISETLTTISFGITMTSFITSFILIFKLDKDIFASKELNQKLLIYFFILSEYIHEGKKLSRINMIKRGLIRYLHTLENNVKNVFFFRSIEFDITLIKEIIEFLSEDMNIMIKNGRQDEIINILNLVKKAYFSAETMQLCGNIETEHTAKLRDLKQALEQHKGLESISTYNEKPLVAKLLNWRTNPNAIIIIFIIIGLILMYYVNITEYSTFLVNNLSVVALIIGIIFYIKRK